MAQFRINQYGEVFEQREQRPPRVLHLVRTLATNARQDVFSKLWLRHLEWMMRRGTWGQVLTILLIWPAALIVIGMIAKWVAVCCFIYGLILAVRELLRRRFTGVSCNFQR